MLEKLIHARWTELDGLGALVISPTRELAIQIFDVLRKIGRHHSFSAGLVIGGRNLREEAERLSRMNILIATPGRLLQHLDQTAGFDVDNLQILVLDEADRTLDLGFQREVDALIEHLPKTRQTLLFSATQSKRVSDLARLSLKDPEYISVHEDAAEATPTSLRQHYIVTPLAEKVSIIYNFIRSNLKKKMIVFASSGKQVRFLYESFRHMRPGIPLLHLHGKQKQMARHNVVQSVSKAESYCLFATDIAARGLDFPEVDWVVQLDCPEDVDTYIHRSGRTARYGRNGDALLFLAPSEEEGFVKRLEQKKVPVQRRGVDDQKRVPITAQLQGMCFQNQDLSWLAKKAFVSYVRSIFLQKDKDVFKFDDLDLDGFAQSLGLPGTPQVKFQKGEDAKKLKNAPRYLLTNDLDSEGEGTKKKDEVRTKAQRMFERKNQDVLSSHYRNLMDEDGNDSDDDFLEVKRVLKDDELDDASGGARIDENALKVVSLGKSQLIIDSNRRAKLLKSKKKLSKFMDKGTKLVFDDDGNAHPLYELQDEEDFKNEGPAEKLRQQFVEAETTRVRDADIQDKELAKQKRKEKRDKRKARERGEILDATGPQLEAPEDEEDPLALLRSLPMAGGRDEEDEEEEDARPRKKIRKSSHGDAESERAGKGKKVIHMDHEPETLEDFESLAAGLLDN